MFCRFIIERFIFLGVVPFMFLPKIMEAKLGLGDHHISYLIGFGIFAILYLMQKARIKAQSKA